MNSLPRKVTIVEVGPRDGLQDEKAAVSVAIKTALIDKLCAAGLTALEAGSFVSPKWVPKMAGSDDVFEHIRSQSARPHHPEQRYIALTPNLTGLQRAINCGAREVGFFVAASEAFNQKNLNCSIADSLNRFDAMMALAKRHSLDVRGYVSCTVACPYEGEIEPTATAAVAKQLHDLGCDEIVLCDTLGTGSPHSISRMLDAVMPHISATKLALHQHDTYGQALVNIYAALQMGVATFDSSVAGLGGCPFAKGAAGNVATEDLVRLLDGLGIEHGIHLDRLIDAGEFICRQLGRSNGSRVAAAMAGKQRG